MDDKGYYVLGLLAGDSAVFTRYGREHIFFSNTHKELSDIVVGFCREHNYESSVYTRTPPKENWSDLHIVEIHEKKLIQTMRNLNVLDIDNNYHIMNNSYFIRGYFETSATFFEYKMKNTMRHRIAFSGTKTMLEELKDIIKPFCVISLISKRKEREHLGVISKSYRFSINRRESKINLLNWLYGGNTEFSSELYKEKVDYYFDSYIKNPINIINEYNNYRTASKAMAKHLNLLVYGERGSSGVGSKSKPIKIITKKKNELLKVVYGWEDAYKYISNIYTELSHQTPPIINFNKKKNDTM